MNKYQLKLIEKQAVIGTAAALAGAKALLTSSGAHMVYHGLGVHIAQNLSMMAALRSKKAAGYIADGLVQGTKGVTDVTPSTLVKRTLMGTFLPEVDAMRNTAHAAGMALKPHLDKMSPRQKYGLSLLSQGHHKRFIEKGFHKDPAIQDAWKAASSKVPGLASVEELIQKGGAKLNDKKTPLISNVMKNLHTGKMYPNHKYVPGSPTSMPGIVGSAAALIKDPVLGAIGLGKNIAEHPVVTNSHIGHAIHKKLTESFVTAPIKQGLANPTRKEGVSDMMSSLLVNPVPTHLKRLGKAVSPGESFNKYHDKLTSVISSLK